MDNNYVLYLCGGIFFSFLMELSNDTTEYFYKTSNDKKEVSQSHIMENLINAIKPSYHYNAKSSSFKKTVSEYRTCKSNGGKIIPFEHNSTKTEFDNCVRNQYENVLEHMREFTEKCFPNYNDTAGCTLIKRTLFLIRNDSSIDNDTPFFIQPDGSPISKEELLKKKDFKFLSFLIGIWHYIITNPTKNENGRQTFQQLFYKATDNRWELNTDCLSPYVHGITDIEIKVSMESSPKKNYECENISEMPNTGRKDRLTIKIYYKGGLLNDEEKKAILSCGPEIIDLDENLDISIMDFHYGPIYKITTEFQVKTQFLTNMKEIIRLSFKIGSFDISGTTNEERWVNISKINDMRCRKKEICTAWFRLDPYSENNYSAEFYIIGKILQ